VAILGSHHDPPPRPLPVHPGHVLGEVEAEPPALEPGLFAGEGAFRKIWSSPLVGDEPDALGVEPLEQPVVEAAPIEDDREPPFAEDLPDCSHDSRHGVGQVGRERLAQVKERATG
jgi:hypothetical protein